MTPEQKARVDHPNLYKRYQEYVQIPENERTFLESAVVNAFLYLVEIEILIIKKKEKYE